MRIVHLSDFHLNTFYTNSNLDKIEKILKEVTSQSFDHLVITGDLTDNAAHEDFVLLRDLFNTFGLLDPGKLSLVIGNHDIFGGIQTAEDILTFPERCVLTNYEEKVRRFRNYFPEVFENCVYNSQNIFPFAKIINEVLFVGINSIAPYSKIKNPFASNGEISIEQFCEINDVLSVHGSNVKARVILVHHHFNKMKIKTGNSSANLWQNIEKQTMKLRKKKRMFNLFNKHKVDIILHGHLHENSVYERKGLKFVNSGGCIKGCPENIMKINYVDIIPGVTEIAAQQIQMDQTFKTKTARQILAPLSILN